MKDLNNWEAEVIDLIEDLLGRHGYKNTVQRREILYLFIEDQETHFSAEEVYEKLKHKGIGMATIYRNINTFVDLRILKEFKVGETSFYELKMYAKKPLHIHFKCEKCDRIEDILDSEIILEYLKLNNLIEEKQNSEIIDADIMFHGLCSECLD